METFHLGRAWKSFWKPKDDGGGGVGDGDIATHETLSQWVATVVNYSSQYGCTAYCAEKIVGAPKVYPKYCDNVNALVVRHYGPWWLMCPSAPPPIEARRSIIATPGQRISTDMFSTLNFFEVIYDTPVHPTAVNIYETFQCGSVVRILARPCIARRGLRPWIELWRGEPQQCEHKARIFSPPLAPCDFSTLHLRIEIDGAGLDYYAEFDCVQLVGRPGVVEESEPSLHGTDETIEKNRQLFARLQIERKRSNDDDASADEDALLLPPSTQARPSSVASVANELQAQVQVPASSGGASSSSDGGPTFKADGDAGDGEAGGDGDGDSDEDEDDSGAFTDLPDEVIELMLEMLPLRDQLRCAMVCKRFFLVAVETLQCRHQLDLQPHFDLVNDRFLAFIAPKLVSLEQLSLSWCGSSSTHDGGLITHAEETGGGGGSGAAEVENAPGTELQMIVTPAAMCSLAAVLPHLRVLRLACCSFVTDETLATVVSCCPSLADIDLSRSFNITASGFGVLQGLLKLQRLNLYNTEAVSVPLVAVVTACHNLEHINLGHPQLHGDIAAKLTVLEALFQHCRKLKSVDLWFWTGIFRTAALPRQRIAALLQLACENCRDLEELDLGWTGLVDHAVATLTTCIQNGMLSKIKKLFLTHGTRFGKEFIRAVADRCQDLRQFDVLGSPVDAATIDFLLGCCPRLAMVDLSFCKNISAHDVTRMKQNFPAVDIKRSYT